MNAVTDIALPMIGFAAAGVAAPYVWSRLLPEGVWPLLANLVMSSASVAAIAGLWRFGLSAPGWADMLQWQALTAIVWAPCVVLAVAQQPRRWTERTW